MLILDANEKPYIDLISQFTLCSYTHTHTHTVCVTDFRFMKKLLLGRFLLSYIIHDFFIVSNFVVQ